MEKKVLKAGIGYTISNYLIKGIVFFSIPIFSRLLSPADYGIYNNYIAFENILCIFLGLALHTSIKNAKYQFKDNFENYNISIVLLVLLNASIWILASNIFINALKNYLPFNRLIINVLLIHSFCTAILQIFNAYNSLYYDYKKFMKISFFNAVGNIVISILLIMIFSTQKYYGRIFGTAVPLIIIAIYIIIFFLKKGRVNLNIDYCKFALKFSLPLIPHSLSQIIMTSLDRIMILYMVGEMESGIYSFSYNIFTIIVITASSIDSVWGPWFYEKMNGKEYSDINKYSKMIILGFSYFIIVVILFSVELVKIMGGKAYYESIYSVIPIVVSGFFSALYMFPSYVEYFYGKTHFIAFGTVIAAVFNFFLNYYWIKEFGYVAAAYTTLLTYILYFIIHYLISKKINSEKMFPIKCIIFVSIIVLVLNLVVLYYIDNLLIRIVLFFMATTIYYLYFNRNYCLKDVVIKLYRKMRKKID